MLVQSVDGLGHEPGNRACRNCLDGKIHPALQRAIESDNVSGNMKCRDLSPAVLTLLVTTSHSCEDEEGIERCIPFLVEPASCLQLAGWFTYLLEQYAFDIRQA